MTRRTTNGDVDAVTSLVQLMTYVPCPRSGVVRFASKLSDRLFGPALATAVAAGHPGRDREKKMAAAAAASRDGSASLFAIVGGRERPT